MLKPPMHNDVVLVSRDMTQPPDRHGKRPEKRLPIKARVQVGAKYIRAKDGTMKKAQLEVDLPAEVILTDGDLIEAKDNQGTWHTGLIIRVDEATNFSGNRTLWRTVYCE